MKIRKATIADIPALLPLVRQYWSFDQIPDYDAQRVGLGLNSLLGDPRVGCGWIATDESSAIGYLLVVYVFSLEHGGLTAEIDEFFLSSQCRAARVGTALLNAAQAEAQRAGCSNLSLQLARSNSAARGFYFARGFSPRSDFELLEKSLPEET